MMKAQPETIYSKNILKVNEWNYTERAGDLLLLSGTNPKSHAELKKVEADEEKNHSFDYIHI